MSRHEVESPVPGVFYRRPDPDSDPFKQEGDKVSKGDTIGLVEIMKNFQEVEAEVDGKLVEYTVENEEEVEAGQTIAAVESDDD
jgi:acetyl-CoA carboxylase biotin carboxyl carrier protein